jgi:hypothetical protein
MKIQAQSDARENPFASARNRFEVLTQRLEAAEVMAMTHAEVERLIDIDGRAVLRDLFQAHVDVRGLGEAAADVVGADGARRPHARIRERALETIFGTVEVRRMGYSAPEVTSLFPRDAELNLPPRLYSHEVERRVAQEAARGSFDAAVEAVASTTGAEVPKRQAEQLAVRAAEDFNRFYETRSRESVAQARKTGGLLITTTDAKGVVMRLEGLREATRKKAEAREHKLQGRLSKGEKSNSKRMAQVASVYTVAPFVRTPEDIIRELRSIKAVDEQVKRPRPEHKRVWASLAKTPAEVVEEMFQEAARRDPEGTKRWVTLLDGNEVQLDLVRAAAKRHGVSPEIVVDFIHVAEYVWDAAFALIGEGQAAAEIWVRERLADVLRGKSSDVAAGMRRAATKRKMPAKDRKPVDECADYLLKYREHLRYHRYLAAGLPIATGVIEGACRHLICDRLDITGARWGLDGAEAILKLRAIRSSGDFDDYWRFHEQVAYVRNHLEKYKAGPPATLPPESPRPRRLSLVK